jgi:hypothetical protein
VSGSRYTMRHRLVSSTGPYHGSPTIVKMSAGGAAAYGILDEIRAAAWIVHTRQQIRDVNRADDQRPTSCSIVPCFRSRDRSEPTSATSIITEVSGAQRILGRIFPTSTHQLIEPCLWSQVPQPILGWKMESIASYCFPRPCRQLFHSSAL